MPRPVRPWFRMYVETFTDRKVRRLTPSQRWVFAAVLGAARESPEPGVLMIAEGVPMTVGELADFADVREKDVRAGLALMAEMGMVLVVDDVISAPNFTRRQYESDNVTARTRAHRERSKDVPKTDVGTFQPGSKERSLNGRRNAPETETETETETTLPRSRGTRIPADWKPPQSEVEWRREAGISDLVARRELPKFLDYWTAKPGQGGVKLDWLATWRNWLRTAQERETAPTDQVQQRVDRRRHDPLGSAR